jgi:hypothetical protein
VVHTDRAGPALPGGAAEIPRESGDPTEVQESRDDATTHRPVKPMPRLGHADSHADVSKDLARSRMALGVTASQEVTAAGFEGTDGAVKNAEHSIFYKLHNVLVKRSDAWILCVGSNISGPLSVML